jgi:uncharacterized protein YdhG (YjbR/CyaY superfamily)
VKTKKPASANVDEYVSTFPPEIQKILNRIRRIIKKRAPGSEETISYQIPTAKLNGAFLIYFAAYKNHIGLYPSPEVTGELADKIATYESGKGSIKFSVHRVHSV